MKIKKIMLSALMATGVAACAINAPSDVPTEAIQPQQLTDYQWTVTKATNRQGQPLAQFGNNTNVKLQFNGQRSNLTGGCNIIGSNYQLEGKTIQFSTPVSTMMACAPEIMAQDTAVAHFMNGQKLHIGLIKTNENQPNLLIENKEGDRLLLKGALSASAQYGQPTTVFWEVKSTCKPSEKNKDLCGLIVRTVDYNDEGIKVKTGEWQKFTGEIQGYNSNPSEFQVIRLNVYKAPSANGELKNVYIFDQIIERSVAAIK